VPGRGEFFVRTTQGPGDTLPVVLIHGWQATADVNFFPLYAPLSERHRVIAADLRGHGRSVYSERGFTLEDAADDNAALLRDLGYERAIVAGYSIGTAVTQTMVQRHPGLVAGVVLMAGEFVPHRRPHEKVYDRMGGWQATAQRLTSGRWGAHRVVSKSARENPALEAHREWLVAEMERGHSADLRAAGRCLARFDGAPIAAAANGLPAAAVITRRDHLVRPVRQERLAEAWRAPVVDLDADHDAPVAQPAAFVAAALQAIGIVRDVVHARSAVDA
jgi:3-oxoadipate enol-lactonase